MTRAAPGVRGAYPLLVEVATRWDDVDRYGHMNNTVHYRLFDTVVNRWMIEAGLLDPAGGAGICLVVESGCRYHAELGFPDPVVAGLRIGRLGGSSVRWEIGLFRGAAAQAAAEGHFVHVHVDATSRRPVPLPDSWRAAMAGLCAG